MLLRMTMDACGLDAGTGVKCYGRCTMQPVSRLLQSFIQHVSTCEEQQWHSRR